MAVLIGVGLWLRRRQKRFEQKMAEELSATPGAACSFPGTTVWGSSGGAVLNAGAAPSKAPRGYNVCGSVPAGQNPSVGTYADTVVATVNF